MIPSLAGVRRVLTQGRHSWKLAVRVEVVLFMVGLFVWKSIKRMQHIQKVLS